MDEGVGEDCLEGGLVREPYDQVGNGYPQHHEHHVHGEPEAPRHQENGEGVRLVDVGPREGDDRGEVVSQGAGDEHDVREGLKAQPPTSGDQPLHTRR